MTERLRSFIYTSLCRKLTTSNPFHTQHGRHGRHLATFNTKTFQPNPKGPNQHLIRKLQKRYEDEDIESQNVFKARSFLRAVKALNVYPEAIRHATHVKAIDGFGEGMTRRIDEILHPGSDPAALASTVKKSTGKTMQEEDPELQQAVKELTRVAGIGPVKARKLYDAGCRSIEDLWLPQHFATLSAPIVAALKFVGLFEKPTPHEQVASLEKAILEILPKDFDMHIVGNYRRKQPLSSSIDILLFHPSFVHIPSPAGDPSKLSNAKPASPQRSRGGPRSASPRLSADARTKQNELLAKSVIEPLTKQGLLASTFSSSPRRWQGLARIPIGSDGGYQADQYERLSGVKDRVGGFVRVDISLLPWPSKGAALLMNTGDSDFNSFVRTTATRMGLQLNELGLWRWKEITRQLSDAVEDPVDESEIKPFPSGFWELVASRTEEDILEELGLEYVEPEKRNYSFVVGRAKRKQ